MVRSQLFYNLGVFLDSEPRDMYAALDEALGMSEIEGPPKRFEYRTISVMPQILQLSIQRIRWNGTSQQKIQHQIPLAEKLYLDRYMADEKMLKKRRTAWDLEAQHRILKAKKSALRSKDLNMDMSNVFAKTNGYLNSLSEQSQELQIDGVDEDLLATVDALSKEIHEEILQIDHSIQDIETQLSGLFVESRNVVYRLHAVFIHVGDRPTAGHWYVYIHDQATNTWRQYNDEKVTIISDINQILRPSTSQNHHATSAVVIYVRESEHDELIQTVCRNPSASQAVPEPLSPPSRVSFVDDFAGSNSNSLEGQSRTCAYTTN